MPVHYHFPTAIYLDRLLKSGTAKLNRDLAAQCSLIRATDPEGRAWSKESYLHGYTSYGSITDLHLRNPYFQDLARAIDRHVRRFARRLEMDLQGGRLEMSSCWVNIMSRFAAHSGHIHPLAVISGTYYVSVPWNSSVLKFEDPRLVNFMAAPPKRADAGPRHRGFVTIEPRSGQLALWEGWLRHEVPPNTAREKRVSISFNYEWR